MDISAAAAYFDDTLCTDAYTPTKKFYAQWDLFDDAKRDGPTTVRRVLSTAPAVVMPVRGAISVAGVCWLVGSAHDDHFSGSVIRRKYNVHLSSGLGIQRTVAETLSGATGYFLHAARVWIKSSKEIDESSNLFSLYDVFVAPSETVAIGNILTVAGQRHWVRNSYPGETGLTILECDELPISCLQTISYRAQTYLPISDTRTATTTAAQCLRVRWQNAFEYADAGSKKYETSDSVGFVLKSAVPAAKAGDTLVAPDGAWNVLEAQSFDASTWHLHLRRAYAS